MKSFLVGILLLIFSVFVDMTFSPPRSRSMYMRRRMQRRKLKQLAMVATVLELIDDEEANNLRGRLLGSRNISRTRKRVEKLWAQLGTLGIIFHHTKLTSKELSNKHLHLIDLFIMRN